MEQRQALMSPRDSRSPSVFWLAAILGLAFILRMHFWGQPFEMDEGLHAYMGWGMLHGLVPFKDIYNSKPPAS